MCRSFGYKISETSAKYFARGRPFSTFLDVSIVAQDHMASLLQRISVGQVRTIRVFGKPMETWRRHMPRGMLLKSDGFASSLRHDQKSTSFQRT